MRTAALLAWLLTGSAASAWEPPSSDGKLKQIIAPVSAAEMKRTVDKLVSFGTRHTLWSQSDAKRDTPETKPPRPKGGRPGKGA